MDSRAALPALALVPLVWAGCAVDVADDVTPGEPPSVQSRDGDVFWAEPDYKADLPLAPPSVIYLHRDGGRFRSGSDDPRNNVSSVLRLGDHLLAPYQGSDEDWADLLSCVQDFFEPYDIVVTDVEPPDSLTRYSEVVFTPTPSSEVTPLDWEAHGIALGSCRPRDDAVALVFTDHPEERLATRERKLRIHCATAAHEIGHTLSLDHSADCADPMYPALRGYCGRDRTFVSGPTACGRLGPGGVVGASEDCSCSGAPTQDSDETLRRVLGARHP